MGYFPKPTHSHSNFRGNTISDEYSLIPLSSNRILTRKFKDAEVIITWFSDEENKPQASEMGYCQSLMQRTEKAFGLLSLATLLSPPWK